MLHVTCQNCGKLNSTTDRQTWKKVTHCKSCGHRLPPTLDNVRWKLKGPIMAIGALLGAIVLIYVANPSDIRAGKRGSEGAGGALIFGSLLGAAVGAGVGYVVSDFVIAPLWWRVQCALNARGCPSKPKDQQ